MLQVSRADNVFHCLLLISLYLQVLSGKIPYHYIRSDVTVVIELHNGNNPRRPTENWVTDGVWEFINRCWAEPSERPAVREVYQYMLNCCEDPSKTRKSSAGTSLPLRIDELDVDEVC